MQSAQQVQLTTGAEKPGKPFIEIPCYSQCAIRISVRKFPKGFFLSFFWLDLEQRECKI